MGWLALDSDVRRFQYYLNGTNQCFFYPTTTHNENWYIANALIRAINCSKQRWQRWQSNHKTKRYLQSNPTDNTNNDHAFTEYRAHRCKGLLTNILTKNRRTPLPSTAVKLWDPIGIVVSSLHRCRIQK